MMVGENGWVMVAWLMNWWVAGWMVDSWQNGWMVVGFGRQMKWWIVGDDLLLF